MTDRSIYSTDRGMLTVGRREGPSLQGIHLEGERVDGGGGGRWRRIRERGRHEGVELERVEGLKEGLAGDRLVTGMVRDGRGTVVGKRMETGS